MEEKNDNVLKRQWSEHSVLLAQYSAVLVLIAMILVQVFEIMNFCAFCLFSSPIVFCH